jgi:hypothetical protein
LTLCLKRGKIFQKSWCFTFISVHQQVFKKLHLADYQSPFFFEIFLVPTSAVTRSTCNGRETHSHFSDRWETYFFIVLDVVIQEEGGNEEKRSRNPSRLGATYGYCRRVPHKYRAEWYHIFLKEAFLSGKRQKVLEIQWENALVVDSTAEGKSWAFSSRSAFPTLAQTFIEAQERSLSTQDSNMSR